MTKNIITRNVTIEEVTYTANDGCVFDNEMDCQIHENNLKDEIMEAKYAKLFVPLDDAISSWINDARWYKVRLATEDDVVDFFTIANQKFTDHFYDGAKTRATFVNEYMNTVRNGGVVELLLQSDCDQYYLSRYDITCSKQETYDRYLQHISDTLVLVEEMKKRIHFVPEETTENK